MRGLVVIVLMLLPVPFGCYPGNRPAPQDELAANTALAVVAALSDNEFERAYSYFNSEVDISWTLAELTENWKAAVGTRGDFQEVTEFYVHQTNIRAANATTVLLQCRFKRGTVAITMEVAEDGRVVQYSGP